MNGLSGTLVELKLMNCCSITVFSQIFMECQYLKYLNLGGCEKLSVEMLMEWNLGRLTHLVLPEHMIKFKEIVCGKLNVGRIEFQQRHHKLMPFFSAVGEVGIGIDNNRIGMLE